ncbi:STAS-like domain-containing protein [Pseudomonas sp. CFBP 13727]|uniref:STAS-like domain-containing protein n=1 Tax=Pseudomonas sp. CFBP 13727 TaxID=2775295 RepID=UPI001780329B|nr:STAS-like domain-containing protein [Pseudomonas sp. CFBP 13727]MBD8625255.1 STAS-like domain-containing protein [Pseudomonas sp. CFBP 13727]
MKVINVKSIVGTNAISMNSGSKLRAAILEEWGSEKITLDFSGIDVFASPFLNASIGALLKSKTIGELQSTLIFEGISDHGRRLLNLVIANALKFFADGAGKTDLGLDQAQKDM